MHINKIKTREESISDFYKIVSRYKDIPLPMLTISAANPDCIKYRLCKSNQLCSISGENFRNINF